MNKNELIKIQKPSVPEQWNYNESVQKVKSFIFKWKNMTSDLFNELWIAREILSKEGRPQITETNVPDKTWDSYCQEIGIEKRTANRWLHAFQIVRNIQRDINDKMFQCCF